MTECTECQTMLPFWSDTLKGEILTCLVCGAELEVTSLNPLEVVIAPHEMEDWGE